MKDFNEWDEEEQQLDELLTVAQRKTIGRRTARLSKRLTRRRAIKQKRMADRGQLQKRSMRAARDILTQRLSGGKKKAELNTAQRIAVSKKLQSRSSAIAKLAKRLFPKTVKKEKERLKAFRSKKSEN